MSRAVIVDMVHARTADLCDFFEAVRAQVNSETNKATITQLEEKFCAGGVLLLDQLLDSRKSDLENLLNTPPSMPTTWLSFLETLGQFKFDKGDVPPSAGVAASDVEQVTDTSAKGRGGFRASIFKSPTRGEAKLGEWLRNEKRWGEIHHWFSQLAVWFDVIKHNEEAFFQGKGIQPGPRGDELFNNIVVKVREGRGHSNSHT